MTTLRAYHNDPSIKRQYLAMAQCHSGLANHILLALAQGIVRVDIERGLVSPVRFANKPYSCISSRGYVVGTLHVNGIRKQIKVHQVIWLAACRDLPEEFVIDHINRIKTDNRLQNLRLVTAQGNATNRRSYLGTNNPSAKLSDADATAIRASHAVHRSYQKVADNFGVSKSLIAQIVRGELWP